VVKICSIMQ